LAFEGGRRLRVTLDQGLNWLGGGGAGCARTLTAWVAEGGVDPPPPGGATAALPCVAFPFAVLEVKTAIGVDGSPSPPPPWLAALVADPAIAAAAPRLSKYLAGAVALYPGVGLDRVGCLGLEVEWMARVTDSAAQPGRAPPSPPPLPAPPAPPPPAGGGDGDSATSVEGVAVKPPLPAAAAPAQTSPPPLAKARTSRVWLPWRGRAQHGRRPGGALFGSAAHLLPVTARTEAGSGSGATAAAATAASPAAPAWPPPRHRVTDAKVFFSNERTLLAWIQISVLLLLLGVSLLNGGGGGGGGGRGGGLPGQPDGPHPTQAASSPAASRAALAAGGIVAPAAVVFMAYAFVVFRSRSARLDRGLHGGAPPAAMHQFDDARGAAILVGLVLLAGVASLTAAFTRIGAGA
jgi:hypothetical protein